MTTQDSVSHFTFTERTNARAFGVLDALTPEPVTQDLHSSVPTILHTGTGLIAFARQRG